MLSGLSSCRRCPWQAHFHEPASGSEGCFERSGEKHASIPTAEDHWNGGDRGRWSNAEYGRLVQTYSRTLDRDERIQQIAQMSAVISEELATASINVNPGIIAFVSALQGLDSVGPESNVSWNVHDWQLR